MDKNRNETVLKALHDIDRNAQIVNDQVYCYCTMDELVEDYVNCLPHPDLKIADGKVVMEGHILVEDHEYGYPKGYSFTDIYYLNQNTVVDFLNAFANCVANEARYIGQCTMYKGMVDAIISTRPDKQWPYDR